MFEFAKGGFFLELLYFAAAASFIVLARAECFEFAKGTFFGIKKAKSLPKLWQKFNEKCDFISVKRQRFRLNGFNAKYWFSIKLKARLNSRI